MLLRGLRTLAPLISRPTALQAGAYPLHSCAVLGEQTICGGYFDMAVTTSGFTIYSRIATVSDKSPPLCSSSIIATQRKDLGDRDRET